VFSNKDAEQRNVTVMRNGQQVQLSDLRAGDNFTAVIITDEPPKVVSEREVQAMAKAAPQPASAPANAPAAAPAPAPAPTEAPAAGAPASRRPPPLPPRSHGGSRRGPATAPLRPRSPRRRRI
jgi:hypothetical protein